MDEGEITVMILDLDKKSDDELLAISNGKIPHGLLSARSTITEQDIMIQAKIILQERQKKSKLWYEKPIGKIIIGVIISIFSVIIIVIFNKIIQLLFY